MKIKKTIIAMSGRKGHGKDTVAKWFMDYLRHEKACRLAFADPIKSMASNVFGWDGKKDAKGRKFLQLLGTEVGRCYDDRLWIDKVVQKIKDSQDRFIFITDLRFPVELQVLKELALVEEGMELITFQVVKKDPDHPIRMMYDGIKWRLRKMLGLEHSSEVGFTRSQVDMVIENDFSDPQETQEDIRSFAEIELGVEVYVFEDDNESE